MFENIDPMSIELLSLAISGALLGGYHLYLRVRLRGDADYTVQAVSNRARAAWVESMMASPENEVLAVQTLRNSTMAAVFLASTAILLIVGVLNLDLSGFKGTIEQLDQQSDIRKSVWLVRLLPLLLDLFCAFFCFSLAIRLYNHVGYLINAAGPHFSPSPSYVAQLVNRSGMYHSLGMRAYYISVPLFFGLFSAFYLIGATVAMVTVLYHVDRAPEIAGHVRAQPTQLRVVKTRHDLRLDRSGGGG